MLNLLDKLSELTTTRNRTALQNFDTTVAALADGSARLEVVKDLEAIEAMLHRSGRTMDDLKAAVEKKRKRLDLAAIVAAAPARRKRREEIRRQACAAEQEFDNAIHAAQAKFSVAITPLNEEASVLDGQLNAAEQARTTLIDTGLRDDAAANKVIMDLQHDLNWMQKERERLTELLRSAENGEAVIASAGKIVNKKSAEEQRQRGRELIAAATKTAAELADIDRQIGEARARQDQARELLAAP